MAAGRSARMGEQKLLMPFNGMPMLDFVIKTVLSCGFDGTYAVVSRETLDRLTPAEGADYIVNPDPDRGQDSSFRHGLSLLPAGSSFAVFLADKPMVTAAQIINLRRRFELLLLAGTQKSALVPRKNGAPGHPAFYSYLWRERFLRSDAGCRSALFRREREKDVEWAEFDDCGHDSFFTDVDTPEDYRRLTGL